MSSPNPFLTSRQFADSLGVSESSVKRWVDDGVITAERTVGGHRRIPLAAAIGFIRQRGTELARPHLLRINAAPSVGAVDEGVVEALHDALLGDRALEAEAIIAGRYLGGADIASIADQLIRPVMHRMGELWRHDAAGILLEHRAVDVCVRVLGEIGSWISAVPESAPAAVVAGGPGDPYLLPPMLASMVLRENGVRAHNLGPCTPLQTVGLAVSRYDARICSMSVSAPPTPRSEAAWLELERQVSGAAGRLVVGGRCAAELPVAVRGCVRMCDSMSDLAAYAAGWLEGIQRTSDSLSAGREGG